MFDSSVLDVGAQFTSWQVSDEVSRVLKKSGITVVPRFLLKKVDEFIGEINCRRAARETFICFPVKNTSNCAKEGFAVTFSWIDKARIIIHFWFENAVLYNRALVGIRLIVGSKSGRTPSPFKPTTAHFLLLDFLNVPRGTRANIIGLGSIAIFRCVNSLPPLPKSISRECIFYLIMHII